MMGVVVHESATGFPFSSFASQGTQCLLIVFRVFFVITECLTYTHLCQYWVCFLLPSVCVFVVVAHQGARKQRGLEPLGVYGNNAAHLFTSRKGCCVFVDGGFGVGQSEGLNGRPLPHRHPPHPFLLMENLSPVFRGDRSVSWY